MVGLGAFLQTGANALEVADAIKAKLEELEKEFSAGHRLCDSRTPPIS